MVESGALERAGAAGNIDAGTTFVRRQGPEVFRKVIVTGVGRGGTTALSSLFTELGYHRGASPLPPFGEEERFRRLLLDADEERLASELEDWSRQHDAVAWKDPKVFAAKGHRFIRRLPDDWLLIAVFRDPLAITQRRVMSDGGDTLQTAAHVARFQSRLIEFVATISQSAALVSYERLIGAPVPTLDSLLPFVVHPRGTPCTASLWQATLNQRHVYRRNADPSIPKEVSP